MNNQSIESLKIKYFRSIKEAEIDFHPGLNVVVGANDAGKSNILRAINLVAQNQPSTDNYIFDPLLLGLRSPKKHGGDCDIQLTTGGRTVGRLRNAVWNKKDERWKAGTENLYTLSGESEPFRSFGRGKVPEIIQQHLNINPVNIAFQLDGPFLLGKTASDVAKYYNSLVNLEVIDKTIANIASTLRKEKGDLKVEEALVEKKTEELKAYDWLKDAENSLVKLEKLNNYLKHISTEWSALAGWIQQLKELQSLDQVLSEITIHKKAVNNLVIKNEEIWELAKRHTELFELTKKLKSLNKENEKLKEIVKYNDKTNTLIKQSNEIDKLIENETELTDYIQKLKDIKEVERQYANVIKHHDEAAKLLVLGGSIEELISKHDLLYDLLEKRLKLDAKQTKIDYELTSLKIEYDELMKDGCPLCERSCDCGKI